MEKILEKLKIDQFKNCAFLMIPDDLKEDFKNYNQEPLSRDHDAIFAFSTSHSEFFTNLKELVDKDLLLDGGSLFICYPKKGNKIYPDFVHRDEIFAKVEMDDDGFIYHSKYRFNRMLGYNDQFTLLEIKKELNYKAKNTVSTRKEDYIHLIPEVEKLIEKNASALAFYKTLSPGYRKDWAVHIFSAKTDETKNKRIEETIHLLNQGFKNMTLYRQSKNK